VQVKVLKSNDNRPGDDNREAGVLEQLHQFVGGYAICAAMAAPAHHFKYLQTVESAFMLYPHPLFFLLSLRLGRTLLA